MLRWNLNRTQTLHFWLGCPWCGDDVSRLHSNLGCWLIFFMILISHAKWSRFDARQAVVATRNCVIIFCSLRLTAQIEKILFKWASTRCFEWGLIVVATQCLGLWNRFSWMNSRFPCWLRTSHFERSSWLLTTLWMGIFFMVSDCVSGGLWCEGLARRLTDWFGTVKVLWSSSLVGPGWRSVSRALGEERKREEPAGEPL